MKRNFTTNHLLAFKFVCSFILITNLLTSTISAQTFTILPSSTQHFFTSVTFADINTAFITGNGPDILRSTNGGNSFSDLNVSFLPANSKLSSSAFMNADTGFVAGGIITSTTQSGFIYKTTDGGNSWNSSISNLPSMINSLHFPSSQVGYAIGGFNSSGIIYKTTDGGNSWNSILNTGSFTTFLPNAYFFDDNTGIIAGHDEVFFESKFIKINGGNVTSNQNNSNYVYFYDIYFTSVDTGFVVGSNFNGNFILKTTDQGNNWTNVYNNINPNDQINSITFVSPNRGLAVGKNGNILQTTNFGNTWANLSSPTNFELTDIAFANQIKGIITGDDGTILQIIICNGNTSSSTLNVMSCEDYTLNNQIYSSSGTYQQILSNSVGCDSTITLNLTINQPSSNSINQTSCTPIIINGETFISSGTYQQTLLNAVGCDSNLTLNLLIHEIDTTITPNGITLTSNQTGTVSYQWLNCPSYTVIPGATSQNYTASSNGSYAVKITNNGCIDTSACYEVVEVSVQDPTINLGFKLYPNPTNGIFYLDFDRGFDHSSIRILDLTGRKIQSLEDVNGNHIELSLKGTQPGLYMVEFEIDQKIYRLKINHSN